MNNIRFKTSSTIGIAIALLILALGFQNCSSGNADDSSGTSSSTQTQNVNSTTPTTSTTTTGNIPDTSTTPATNVISAFSAVAVISGGSDSLSLRAVTTFATEHKNKQGFVFVGALLPDARWFFLSESKAWSDNAFERRWIEYTSDDSVEFYANILNLPVAAQSLPILTGDDVRTFSGAKIFVGYGLGSNFKNAWLEMAQANRYKQIYTVP